jgi:hypothetical protein
MKSYKNNTSKEELEEALARMDFFTAWFTDSTKPNDMEACNTAWKESRTSKGEHSKTSERR